MIDSEISTCSASQTDNIYYPAIKSCCCAVECLQTFLQNMEQQDQVFSPDEEFFSPPLEALSKQEPSDEILHAIARGIICMLSVLLPQLHHVSSITEGGVPSVTLSQIGQDILEKIVQFFSFIRYYAHFSVLELVHLLILLARLISVEVETSKKTHQTIVSLGNLGTLLVCAAAIALKMDRDAGVKNSWWAKMFGVGLKVLNESEIVFLKKIHFICRLDPVEYKRVLQHSLAWIPSELHHLQGASSKQLLTPQFDVASPTSPGD